MPKKTITQEQVAIAYRISANVYNGALKRVEGINKLVEQGLNKSSAGDFVNCYRYLVQGREFHRAMSASAMDYFLTQIYKDVGQGALHNAVNALDKHILYWEQHYKTTAHAMRGLEKKHREYTLLPPTLNSFLAEFDQKIQDSLNSDRQERKKRLTSGNDKAKPKKITASITVFQRNPDVVAERLYIAGGVCGSCKQKAPFLRAKDGTPYLEVHHIQPLADGGLDQLENTIALCPNCHRKAHFG